MAGHMITDMDIYVLVRAPCSRSGNEKRFLKTAADTTPTSLLTTMVDKRRKRKEAVTLSSGANVEMAL